MSTTTETTQRSPDTASATKIRCVVGYPKSRLASPPMCAKYGNVELRLAFIGANKQLFTTHYTLTSA